MLIARIFVLSVLLLPSLTFAAWWNPTSWLKRESATPQAISQPVEVTSSTTSTSTVVEKVIEKPVEKIVVEKTVDLAPILNRLAVLERKIQILENRAPIVLKETGSSEEIDDVKSDLDDITTRVGDFIWCVNHWASIGDPVMEDDWRHCKNLHGF